MVKRCRAGGGGYSLVALVMIVAVMNIVIAASLPLWSTAIQREKEEELVFRGLQYAEAIRVFQTRHGRYPVRLEELLEVEPRSIRQLYPEPMTEEGAWGLLFNAAPNRPRPGQPGQPGQPDDPDDGRQRPGEEDEERRRRGRTGIGTRAGQTAPRPIVGVFSPSDEQAFRSFAGARTYADWQFRSELIPLPVALGETVSRATSDWIGRPFREGLEPVSRDVPGTGTAGAEDDRGRRGAGRRAGTGAEDDARRRREARGSGGG